MKYLPLLFLAGCAAQSGQFVDRGLFNNSPFVTARAASPDQARARAMAAMPAGFELDKKYDQPVLSCGLPGEAAIFDKASAPHCPSGSYRVDIALLPLGGEERDAILRTRGDDTP